MYNSFMKVYGNIYKIINLINNKIYIGQTTKDIYYRFKCHIYKSYTVPKCRYALHHAINKYGKENFIIEKICECFSKNELDKREIYYIYKYKSYNRKYGYNLKLHYSHGMHSEETKEKIRRKRLGKKTSKETIEKLRKLSTGRKHTEEAKQKISKYRKKHYTKVILTEDGRKRLSEKNSKHQSGKGNSMYGRKGKLNPNSKKVMMIDLQTGDIIKLFESVGLAEKWLKENVNNKASHSNIVNVCNKNRSFAYGYK